MQHIVAVGRLMLANARDVVPVVAVVVFFQVAVVGRPVPQLPEALAGLLFVIVGLSLFIRGLDMSLFVLGQDLAGAIARRGNLAILLGFAFALGFGSTVAEPALFSVVAKATDAAVAAGLVDGKEGAARFALLLQYATSAAVGGALALGCLRIVMGWPSMGLLIGGYGAAALLMLAGNSPLAGVALDAGAAATSAINIPLITALGVGLATVVRGRSPLSDGFGMVALASLMPVLLVLLAGLAIG
ncbi:MAG: DUF1538 domain-containing protein [Bradyrhizobiaceae bacterium]|nr:MAG: DUF1538 domain-containing protein [Bradyrhizobiaceae bacterium]